MLSRILTSLAIGLPIAYISYLSTLPKHKLFAHVLSIFNTPVGYYFYHFSLPSASSPSKSNKKNDDGNGKKENDEPEEPKGHRRVIKGVNDYEVTLYSLGLDLKMVIGSGIADRYCFFEFALVAFLVWAI
jgi:hypothetical protein